MFQSNTINAAEYEEIRTQLGIVSRLEIQIVLSVDTNGER